MSLRLIEIFVPKEKGDRVTDLLQKFSLLGVWYDYLSNQQLLVKVLLYPTEVESVISSLNEKFEGIEDFRLLLLPVEASLPLPKLPELTASESELIDGEIAPTTSRIAKEEIYTRVAQDVQLSWTQISMVILSSVIAAIGLKRNSETVIIGAMVIAPLLQPNMALALATTLGEKALAVRTVKVGAAGIAIALAISTLIGVVFPVSPDLTQVAMRTRVSLAEVVLAFASGLAGAISLTMGERSAIVGVMVSVALLPPLVVLGMMLGSGHWQPALGAALLVLTNITCLNLAAIATFLIQDVRPQAWWELLKARKMTSVVAGAWFLLFLALVGSIFWLNFGNA